MNSFRASARLRPLHLLAGAVLLPVLVLCTDAARAADTTAARQLERFSREAGSPGQADRGQAFFTSRQGGQWACAACHGNPPTTPGKHAGTGKAIEPLAPAFNAQAFTDSAKVDKWFRRNCNDVAKRECSAAEKADVMAYLVGLNP